MSKSFGAPKGCKWYHKTDGKDGYLTKRVDPGDPLPDSSWILGQRPKSEEMKQKMSIANKGRVMTDEWRARMSAASKGKPKSEEHKKAMSIAQKARLAK